MLIIALCDCSVNTGKHSLLFLWTPKRNISVSKTKLIFLLAENIHCVQIIVSCRPCSAHISNTKKCCFGFNYYCKCLLTARLFTFLQYFHWHSRAFFSVSWCPFSFIIHRYGTSRCQSAFLLRIEHVSSRSYARLCVCVLYIKCFLLYFPLLTK